MKVMIRREDEAKGRDLGDMDHQNFHHLFQNMKERGVYSPDHDHIYDLEHQYVDEGPGGNAYVEIIIPWPEEEQT